MDNRQIIDRYYELANAGQWEKWCNLFSEDMVMDEQLAGHIEGLTTLRPMMAGMGSAYSRFRNEPKQILVDGDQGAAVSHISAANSAGEPIEAEVMNYFRFEGGKIAYMANFHDSLPFEPFLRQLQASPAT
ncbi:MAG: nuclear transport factor 2 family protein [Trueperaceae bacterium]